MQVAQSCAAPVLPHTEAPRSHRAPWIIGAGVLLAGLVVLALTMGR